MKFTVTIGEEERKEIGRMIDGFGPFKDSFRVHTGNAVKTMSSYDSEKKTRIVVIDIDSGYTQKILSAFSKHLPVITASAFTIATSLRSFFMHIDEIDNEYSNHENNAGIDSAA